MADHDARQIAVLGDAHKRAGYFADLRYAASGALHQWVVHGLNRIDDDDIRFYLIDVCEYR